MWSEQVRNRTDSYQSFNIAKSLSSSTPETLKALKKDLLGVPGTGENLGKLVHPVTGDVLNLSREVRKAIEARIKEIEGFPR
jgi:hypothetical protein